MNHVGEPDAPWEPRSTAEVLDRRRTANGEIVLRRGAAGVELICDGVFAMSSHLGGHSERLQVELTLRAASPARALLIGGLGLGFALARAVADPTLRRIEVVEVEPAIIDWHRSLLAELTAGALDDPRVTVVEDDVADVIRERHSLDAIVLDVDNGPQWLLRPDNARLYRPAFLDSCATALRRRGALSVWAAHHSPELLAMLTPRFARVESVDVEVPRGDPDWIVVASGPRADTG